MTPVRAGAHVCTVEYVRTDTLKASVFLYLIFDFPSILCLPSFDCPSAGRREPRGSDEIIPRGTAAEMG